MHARAAAPDEQDLPATCHRDPLPAAGTTRIDTPALAGVYSRARASLDPPGTSSSAAMRFRRDAASPAVTPYLLLVIRYRVLISGQVQGVYFRDTCRRMALDHGVSGWVRNLPDGRVEAVFEGPAEGVHHLLDWTRRGPHLAVVADVAVQAEHPEGIGTFLIR